jgi:hypothetical protein
MPKSTRIWFHVPEKQAEEIKQACYVTIYEKTSDPLYLFIRDNRRATLHDAYVHFKYNIKKKQIMSMCDKTGLTLKDYPLK